MLRACAKAYLMLRACVKSLLDAENMCP